MRQPPLANAELAVMQLLWTREHMTARQVQEQLYVNATRAQHGTVQRLLQRLAEKGYVRRDASQAVNLFSAVISRQAYAGQQLENLASKLTAGSIAPLIMHLVEENRISPAEIEQLRAILGERENGDQS